MGMENLRRSAAFYSAMGLSLLITACGGGSTTPPPPTTYTLTVNSTNPASAVAITVSPADTSGAANGNTSFTRTYDAGASVTLTAPATSGGNNFTSWSGGCTSATVTCTVAMNAGTTVTANYTAPAKITPTVTVTPGASSITTAQPLAVNVTVTVPAGDATPTGSVTLTSGTYTSAAATLSSGGATINVPAGSLATGSDTLTVSYTPDTASSSVYNSASGTNSVTVTVPARITPTVTVTPGASSITTAQPLAVTVAVSGGAGNPTPTGSVTLTSGTYTSTAATLSSGSATINVPAGSLATGSDSLTVSYTPDTASSSSYNSGTGTSPAVTVTHVYVLTVNSSNPASGLAITVSPADNNGAGNGTTAFTRTYNSGASVTLTAPATSGSNTFSSWTGCTSASTVTCTVAMNASATVTANYATPTFVLTVNSTNPASGLAITVSPADVNSATNGTTSFTRTYNSGTSVTLTAPATSGSNTFTSWTGCTSASTVTCTVALGVNTTVTANYAAPAKTTPTVSVTPSASSITAAQPLSVTVVVNGGIGKPTPTGSVTLTSGSYTSTAATLSSGSATINVAAGSLAGGSDTLTVSYAPDAANSSVYNSASGTNSVTVLITPTVTVTPSASSITTAQPLTVTVVVSGGAGNPTPTGSVTLTSPGYFSAATTLTSSGAGTGSATINIAAGALPAGNDVLKATYSPDLASASIYIGSSGTASAVSVTSVAAITVTAPSTSLAVTDQILGMNMAVWNDTTFSDAVSPFKAAGIKAVRWPGGSTSDDYHWEGTSNNPLAPSMCPTGSYAFPTSTFANFVNDLAVPAGLDIALTADYGSDPACTGGGLPSEAVAWVTNALSLGVTVSHMTVGNEEYGSWEEDLHAIPNDPTTYASTVVGASGYYTLIKAASPNTLVGVDVDEDNTTNGWDNIVLANAKGSYDFVEYHYYPETPGSESDTFLTHTAAQNLTNNIKTIRSELTKWGTPNTPIYVGEIGGPYTNPGKQSWSITQGLYAGQVLGEMMNDGISRLTWWIGFGNCNGQSGNITSSVYGWQDFGAYNVFSDGSADTDCPGAGPVGTMSPTAEAFNLFQNVAVDGETVLTAAVTGDTTDVRAYAATHFGGTGTALVLFNLNETASSQVAVTLSGQTTATSVSVTTYDKSIYDQTNATPPVWALPTTTTNNAPTLPLTLTLTPWSMNVVLIQ